LILTEQALLAKLQTGEDSFTQFKRHIHSDVQLSEEIVAFANSDGGYILIGIDEDKMGKGVLIGIENTKNLNNHISNASMEHCIPPVFPKMQTLLIDHKIVVVLYIEKGIQQPYRTKSGKYLMRSGADKRAVSQEELSRMLQGSGSFHVEELPIRGAIIEQALHSIA
jgi:ATP-dependent DNA helicase RecG